MKTKWRTNLCPATCPKLTQSYRFRFTSPFKTWSWITGDDINYPCCLCGLGTLEPGTENVKKTRAWLKEWDLEGGLELGTQNKENRGRVRVKEKYRKNHR